MESSTLEIKVLFGKDLKAFNFFQKLSLYVQVSIISDDPDKKLEQKRQDRTPADKEGDGNPEWNHEMRFDLKDVTFHDCDHIFIKFELRHGGAIFGDKTIGEVCVPIKDLLSEFNGVARFVNYEVRTTDRKPNGVLTFSYKVNVKNSALGNIYYPGSHITGFPTAHQPQQQTSEIRYPALDVHGSLAEINYQVPSAPPQVPCPVPSSSPEVLYPPLELHTTRQQDVQYLSPGTPHGPHPAQESYYAPPDAYYPPPPPPPVFSHPPPPPPAMEHGAYYPPPHPWPPRPHTGFHNCSMPGTWGRADGHWHSFGSGGASPNGYPYAGFRHSSSWTGR